MPSNDEISDQIKSAIQAHGMWKARLNTAIETQTSEFDIATVKSPHNCDFGKWLDGEKLNLMQSPHFEKVSFLHEKVHVKTAKVTSLALFGKAAEAEKNIAQDSDFANLSAELTREMMASKRSLTAS